MSIPDYRIFFRRCAAFFLAEEDGQPVGFAQCQLRHDYVEGNRRRKPRRNSLRSSRTNRKWIP